MRWYQRLLGFHGIMLALAAGLVWAFREVAEEALEAETMPMNRAIVLAFHDHASPALDAVALALAALCSPGGILVSGTLLGAWLLRTGRRADAISLAAVLVGGTLLTFIAKSAYQQARPDLFPRLVHEASFSFPSGHASMSLCLYGFLAGWLVAQDPRSPWRWGTAVALIGLAGLVGLSRIYLGVHWPTDVLAGALLAGFWLALCATARRWFHRARS